MYRKKPTAKLNVSESNLFDLIKSKSSNIKITSLSEALNTRHTEDNIEFTPLTYAHFCGHDNLVLQIAQTHSPKENDEEGYGMVLVRLLASGNKKYNPHVLALIKEYTVLTHTFKGKSCLHWAIEKSWSLEVIDALLKNKHDISLLDNQSKAPIESIHSLYQRNLLDSKCLELPRTLIKKIVDNNPQANDVDSQHYGKFLTGILRWAAQNSTFLFINDLLTICELLINANARLSFSFPDDGNTPMHWAVRIYNFDLMLLLLKKSPLDAKNNCNQTPVELLTSLSNQRAFNDYCKIIKKFADALESSADALESSRDSFKEAFVKIVQFSGGSWDWYPDRYSACESLLLKVKVDAEGLIPSAFCDGSQVTCLQYSIQIKNIKLCELILKAQPELIFARDDRKNNAITSTVLLGNLPILRLLLESLKTIQDKERIPEELGEALLRLLESNVESKMATRSSSVFNDYCKIIKIFADALESSADALESSADALESSRDSFKEAFVKIVQFNGGSWDWYPDRYSACESLLLKVKVDAGALIPSAFCDRSQVTCLQYSIQKNNIKLCKLILRAQPELIFARDDRDNNAITCTVLLGNLPILRLLLKSLNKIQDKERIPEELGEALLRLLESNVKSKIEMAELLFAGEASLNKKTNTGETVLHLVARQGLSTLYDLFAPKMTQELIRKKNLDGKTAVNLLPKSSKVPEFLYGPIENELPQESLYKLIRAEKQKDSFRNNPLHQVATTFGGSRTNKTRDLLLKLSQISDHNQFNSSLESSINYLERNPLDSFEKDLIKRLREIQQKIDVQELNTYGV